MVLWGQNRNPEGERGGSPAGKSLPAGASIAVPPPFLVYKRRLYVLARRPPVLDHRQAMMDSIFGSAGATAPAQRPRTGDRVRVAVDTRVLRGPILGQTPAGHRPKARRDREMPRFVPRDI